MSTAQPDQFADPESSGKDSAQAPIFLIGYRGTGKTTVARLLAQRLAFDWVDADDEIEHRAGKTIAQIFADDGQRSFRELEAGVAAELCLRKRTVVALGGGSVLSEATRAAIRSAGLCVWLTGSSTTLARRLAGDASTVSRRPSLTSAGGAAEIETLLAERTPLYRACATFAVDTEGKSPAQVVDEIAARLRSNM
jgi:shikimate kinase